MSQMLDYEDMSSITLADLYKEVEGMGGATAMEFRFNNPDKSHPDFVVLAAAGPAGPMLIRMAKLVAAAVVSVDHWNTLNNTLNAAKDILDQRRGGGDE